MHVQILIRGIYSQCELWKSMAQAQFFKWRREDTPDILVQMALRPSVFGTYELVIPKESLPTLLSMLGVTSSKDIGCPLTTKNKLNMAAMRRMCGVSKIPEKIWKEAREIPPSMTLKDSERGMSSMRIPGVSVHVLGIKKDEMGEFTDEKTGIVYKQEML